MPIPPPARSTVRSLCLAACCLLAPLWLRGDDAAAQAPASAAPAPKSVAAIQDATDRTLIRDLLAYIKASPKADDLDQAYMKVFDKAIEHDWFAEHEAVAQQYLAAYPDGPVRSLARIVVTMGRAGAGKYDEALASYEALIAGLGGADQEEFAVTFTESLAEAATAAGEVAIARKVYDDYMKKFGADNPNLVQRVQAELGQLDKVGTAVPDASVTDLAGRPFRFADLKGKYVLVDFWATWCAPCTAELPRMQAAYAKYKGKGFEVVGVSLDEAKGAVDEFVKARKIPWRQVHNATSHGDLVEAFGVRTIPATFLVDPSGKIIRLEVRGAALDKALETLIR